MIYRKHCDMVYETVTDLEYEQKCSTEYEQQCHGYGYHQSCEKVRVALNIVTVLWNLTLNSCLVDLRIFMS